MNNRVISVPSISASNVQRAFQQALLSPSSDKDNSKFSSMEEALEFLKEDYSLLLIFPFVFDNIFCMLC